ncbi:MAG: YraN family protein, partial [Oscillospiraceae bacterium]|nr:YraN family protein [Oscillospiraceae bacterium]
MSLTNQDSHTTGNLGEAAVCRYLTAQGYQILDRNFRIRGGEIDIIAARGE